MTGSGFPTLLTVTITLTVLSHLADARVLYSFHKQTNKSNNTVSYNDVSKWQSGGGGRTTESTQQHSGMQADQGLNTEKLTELELLRDTHRQMVQLRSNMANLKYQNHMIYKQMKRYNNRCMGGTGSDNQCCFGSCCERRPY